jgi:hypothetical protein
MSSTLRMHSSTEMLTGCAMLNMDVDVVAFTPADVELEAPVAAVADNARLFPATGVLLCQAVKSKLRCVTTTSASDGGRSRKCSMRSPSTRLRCGEERRSLQNRRNSS